MSNIFQVAKQCGVSIATVSRVFNQKPRVGAATRQKVLDVAVRLNYSPKYTARRDRVVILMEGPAVSSYASQLLMAVTNRLAQRQLAYDILLMEQFALLQPNFAQGVLAILYQTESLARLGQFRDLPVIAINRPRANRNRNQHAVYVNQRQGVELALKHLAACGHRKVAFCLAPAEKNWVVCERFAGYRDGVRRWRLSTEPRLVQQPLSQAGYVEAVSNVMRAGATALVVPGEDLGQFVNYALYTLNKSAPDDLSVISYENPLVSPYLTPPHTTISQNLGHLAEQAVTLMARLIGGAVLKPVNLELKNSLIERQSVKSLK